MRIVDEQAGRRGFRVPAAVTLRECSVVIVGSKCRICGRDFKCESDVALHTQWRHNAAAGYGSLMDILDHGLNLGDLGDQKCDVCDMPFGTISDLRIHKRLMHRHQQRSRQRGRRSRREMVRVKFKLNGVTTTDVSLDRRYMINLQNGSSETEQYLVDVFTQTLEPQESERHQDDRATGSSIDLSFPNHVANKSHMQHGDGIRPHKAGPTNRYIVGKFTSTKDDATACRTVVVGRSLVKITNTPHKDAIAGSDGSCEGYKSHCYLTSQETEADVFIKAFADSLDRDKKDASRTNERDKRSVYCQSEISLSNNDTKVFLVCQPETSDDTSLGSKQNSWPSESPRYSIGWSDEVAGIQETAGLANFVIDSTETIVNNHEEYHDIDRDVKRLHPPPLRRFNEKIESMNVNTSIDDDVQEVLRITRGNAQCDINHESPNRMEREILVQNAVSDTFTLPPQVEQQQIVCPEKCNVAFTTNYEPSDYRSFMTVTESNYEFLTNSFDKKLGIYLEDLHHYGIRLYNDLPEINNNFEEYAVYGHQDFFETWKQSGEPQYGLKTNDNEPAVVLD
ncbi:uncharacterized protein LOC105830649 [Monomorium pharaonis]|uniref:uncharacterized protein LOC105830649 n=1 Tax=Monomorium pharaonis TaxID=307658 RepID=UPI00063EDD88|nr:uncharacterized protein LOC105830649 [Monomorium pharaonis]